MASWPSFALAELASEKVALFFFALVKLALCIAAMLATRNGGFYVCSRLAVFLKKGAPLFPSNADFSFE